MACLECTDPLCPPAPYRCACERDCWIGAPEDYLDCMAACDPECTFPALSPTILDGLRCTGSISNPGCIEDCAAVRTESRGICLDAYGGCVDHCDCLGDCDPLDDDCLNACDPELAAALAACEADRLSCRDGCGGDAGCEDACDSSAAACVTSAGSEQRACLDLCDPFDPVCRAACYPENEGCLEDCEATRDPCLAAADASETACVAACPDEYADCNQDCDDDYDAEMAGCEGAPSCVCRETAYYNRVICRLACDSAAVPDWTQCGIDVAEAAAECCDTALGNCYAPAEVDFLNDMASPESDYLVCARAKWDSLFAGRDLAACDFDTKSPDLEDCLITYRSALAPRVRARRIARATCERDEIRRENLEDRKRPECGARYFLCTETADAEYDYGNTLCDIAREICERACVVAHPDFPFYCQVGCSTDWAACVHPVAYAWNAALFACCEQEYHHVRYDHAYDACWNACELARFDDNFACWRVEQDCYTDCGADPVCNAACATSLGDCLAEAEAARDLCRDACPLPADCPACRFPLGPVLPVVRIAPCCIQETSSCCEGCICAYLNSEAECVDAEDPETCVTEGQTGWQAAYETCVISACNSLDPPEFCVFDPHDAETC